MNDERIHLLLYFFEGPFCKQNDFNNILKFQKFVNVIPIIGKADNYNEKELREFKCRIINEAALHKIKFFDCESAISSFFQNVCY